MILDYDQRSVVEAPITVNLLVQAGPGRGKTQVLVSRIVHLIETGQCSPGELLVLSFSRAARDELRKRIGKLDESSLVSAVTIRTLDSFATYTLQIASGDVSGTYDERIERAIRDISDDPETCGVNQYKHVFIDEAQDIIGCRADMVLELLDRMPHAGFTVFADSAQAIYDFSLLGDDSQTNSFEMLNVFLCRDQPEPTREIQLNNYYRSSDPELIELCQKPWKSLVEQNHKKAESELNVCLSNVSDGGTLNNIKWPTEDKGQTRAVICYSNGQVLLAASRAIQAGENVVVARGGRDWAHPYWIGSLFLGLSQSEEITLELLTGKLSDRIPKGISPEDIHKALRFGCRSGRSNPKVKDIVRALNCGEHFASLLPLELGGNPIVFSSIHRAKGREYDEVAYVDFKQNEEWHEKEPTPGYNQRVRFVGLSRAKARNFKLELTSDIRLAVSRKTDRWTEIKFIGNGRRGVEAFEVGLQGDVDPTSFVRYSSFDQVIEAQTKLIKNSKRGRVVDLILGQARERDNQPIYSIVDRLSGEKIGEMSSRFTNNINQTRNTVQGWGSQSQLPIRLEGCWIRGIYTVTPADCESLEGLPNEINSGLLWCYIEIEGLAKAIWPCG
jgi:DNA helicase-2/ATP-dependent DNA helicase PcrA